MAPHRLSFQDFAELFHDLHRSELAKYLKAVDYADLSGEGRHVLDPLNQLHYTVEGLEKDHGRRGPESWTVPRGNQGWPQNRPPRSDNGRSTPSQQPESGMSAADVATLQAEIAKLKKEAKSQASDLKSVTKELTTANATIETLKVTLAVEYATNGKHHAAAQEYSGLKDMKKEERLRKQGKGDVDGANNAQTVALDYEYKSGKMLVKAGQFEEAKGALKSVLEKRKRIHDDYAVKRPDNREAQLLLCTILRLQGNLVEAEELYRQSTSLRIAKSDTTEENRTWALQNAFYLVFVHVELEDYDNVKRDMQDVWACKDKASNDFRKTMEIESLKMVELLNRRRQSTLADSILEIVRTGSPDASSELRKSLVKKGLDHFRLNNYDEAVFHLRKAWNDHAEMQTASPTPGWKLALALCLVQQPTARATTKTLEEAQGVLKTLLKIGRGKRGPIDPSGQGLFTSIDVKAVLAHVQLLLGDFNGSQASAQEVYNAHGTATPANLKAVSHTFNQANILIRALCKQNTYDSYKAAEKVWDAIYAEYGKANKANIDKPLLKLHAAAGHQLADDWTAYVWKTRKVAAKTAPKIKQQAVKLNERAR